MANRYKNLPNPFLVLAPLYDVTDSVFRRVVAECAPPDLFFTEFVNADGLQSPGRDRLIHRLKFTDAEQPLIVQIWGRNPENFYKTTQEILDGTLAREANKLRIKDASGVQGADGVSGSAGKQDSATLNFTGVDLNMGCPDKAVLKNACGGAMIQHPEMAVEIIKATKEGAQGKIPVSVKTRIGFREYNPDWLRILLEQKVSMLSVHLRTVREMSKVPAHWEYMSEIRKIRDEVSPGTLLVGNGDVGSRAEAEKLAQEYGIDGVMIGRGVFSDPFVFSRESPWAEMSPVEKLGIYRKHVDLFAETWRNNERPIVTLNKFCKIYVSGFDGAKEYRDQLMYCKNISELQYKLGSITDTLRT